MHTVPRSHRRSVPRWSLWLVAVACFGPLTAVWLLGVLYSAFWLSMLPLLLAEPAERLPDSREAILGAVSAMAFVSAGRIGLIGLVRVLTLPHTERPESHRYITIGMVAVGLTALLIFDLPMLGGTLSDFSDSIAGTLVYLVLPFGGGAWILANSWRFLVAGRVRSSVDIRGLENRTTRAR